METKEKLDWGLYNVGIMDESTLRSIIKQIKEGTDNRAHVEEADIFIRAFAPNKRRVLTAAKVGHRAWHVRAVKGLIIAETEQ